MDTFLRVPPQPPNTPACCGMPRLSGISLHSSPADSGFYFISSQSPVKKNKTFKQSSQQKIKKGIKTLDPTETSNRLADDCKCLYLYFKVHSMFH